MVRSTRTLFVLFGAVIAATFLVALFSGTISYFLPSGKDSSLRSVSAVVTISNPFIFSFNTAGTLHEAASPSQSSSPYWWLNSGGKIIISNGTGKSIEGNLPFLDKWRLLYASSNPTDTDNGYHPQNLLRLITKSTVGNSRTEAQFMVTNDNFSSSANRNGSNGLLLMTRYVNGDTLYYGGIRVDGTAVIKKKYNGTYYTMAQKQIFPGTYNGNMNLIPHNEWISLRLENIRNTDGSLTLRLFMKRANETSWTKLLETKDSGNFGGTPAITGAGNGGIRTDFMDVRFESFRMEAL